MVVLLQWFVLGLPCSFAFCVKSWNLRSGRGRMQGGVILSPPLEIRFWNIRSSLSDTTAIFGIPDPSEVSSSLAVIPAAMLLVSTLLDSSKKSLVSRNALSNIAEGTFLEGKELDCVYKASRDGWSAVDFHEAVDQRGSGIVVARSRSGKVFGGYNPVGWRSTDDYFLSNRAFLFSTAGSIILKYPILSSLNSAIYDYASAGPTFGSQDLQMGPSQAAVLGGFTGPDMENVRTNAGNLRQCKSVPGFAYATDEKWPIRGACALVEVEVYCQKL